MQGAEAEEEPGHIDMDVYCIQNMSTGPQAQLRSINMQNMVIRRMEQHEDLISDQQSDIWQL